MHFQVVCIFFSLAAFYPATFTDILADPGATSRDDAIFSDESLLQELKLSLKNIASSRLVVPGSPRMIYREMYVKLEKN